MADHSRLAPSSAGVWGARNGCPGSVALQERFPESRDRDQTAAEEGTAAHWVAENLVNAMCHPKELIGLPAPNKVIIDQEMIDAALVFSNNVGDTRRYHVGIPAFTEQRVAATSIHPECWGTSDCISYAPDVRTLYVWDFKYGRGFVEAFENLQAACYAQAAIDTLRFDPATIVMRIVQPRAYSGEGPIREWRISREAFQPYIDQLRKAAAEATVPNAPTRSGTHCRYCSALRACMTGQRAGISLFETVGGIEAHELDPHSLGLMAKIVSRAYEQLGYVKSAYETQIESIYRQGNQVPGWSMSPGRGSEKWTMTDEQMLSLGRKLGVDLSKPGVLTPNQAREARMDPDLIKQFSERVPGSLRVVETNEKSLRKIFT